MSVKTNKSGFARRVVSSKPSTWSAIDLKSTLLADGTEKVDPIPIVAPVRLPSIADRIKMYENAGALRQLAFDADYDPETGKFRSGIADDDFLDYLDDLPEEGLTPYELDDHEISHNANMARNARKEAEKRIKASKATPLKGGALEASQSTEKAPPEAAKQPL